MALNEQKTRNLLMAPAPHLHLGVSVPGTMYSILLALAPVVVFSVYTYGWHAARVVSLGVGGAMLWEAVILSVFRRPVTIWDGTAAVTGLVFALLLPASSPWWLVLVGSFFAMLVGKHIYGGNGGNPFNAALIGWAAIRLSWGPYIDLNTAVINYDFSYPVEYPLAVLKKAGIAGLSAFNYTTGDMLSGKLDLFMGKQIGGLGTTMILLIILGGLFLIIRGIISWRIPFFFLVGVALTALLFWLKAGDTYADPLFHLLTGSAMFGAFFIAPDYSSSPVNRTAMAIYGLGCGVFTVIFRAWSTYPDGVVFAILIMNILNPLVDKIRPRVPGAAVSAEGEG